MRRRLFPSALLLVSCSILATESARAAEKPPRKAGKKTVVKSDGAAGLRAYRDPLTGKLRAPTPEEARALSKRTEAARPVVELEAIEHPNGMTSVDLKDAFLMDIVVRRNADGSLSFNCAPGSRRTSPPPAPEAK